MEEKYGETIMEERKILTPQSVQQDLDALGQYKTADVDRLIRRYVKEQADAAPLREHILTEQQSAEAQGDLRRMRSCHAAGQ